jgi:hypothetical protein
LIRKNRVRLYSTGPGVQKTHPMRRAVLVLGEVAMVLVPVCTGIALWRYTRADLSRSYASLIRAVHRVA